MKGMQIYYINLMHKIYSKKILLKIYNAILNREIKYAIVTIQIINK